MLRATTRPRIDHNGETLDVCARQLAGQLQSRTAFYPGELPKDPRICLSPARAGGRLNGWIGDYQIMRFAPARLNLMRPGDGPPPIRLGPPAWSS